MALKDFAHGVVLPDLTDDALAAQTFYKGEVARLLLMAPDVQRQNVMAEASYRTTVIRPDGVNHLSSFGVVGDILAIRDVLRENGWMK
jgi:hypothetical protein